MLKLNYSQIKRIYDHIDFADDEVITSAMYDESDHELDCTIECNGQISAYCATLTQEQADAIIGKAKLTAKMLKALPKKIKAAIFASAVNRGFWDYFDQCKWMPHLHKYRYYYTAFCTLPKLIIFSMLPDNFGTLFLNVLSDLILVMIIIEHLNCRMEESVDKSAYQENVNTKIEPEHHDNRSCQASIYGI